MRIQTVSVLMLVVGCATDGDDEVEPLLSDTTQALTCPAPALDVHRSLVVTDPAILAKFSFKRVMTKVNTTANGSGTPLQLYKEWMGTWASCGAGVDPNGYGIDCTRPESQFGAFDPFQATGPRFVPVALFNRFDLAPASGTDCGEYRVVYALQGSPGDRAFIIFEARLPNPDVSQGLAGCRGVTNFWARLSLDNDVASRATKLEKFYFAGLVAEGFTYSPVVTAGNYGLGATGAATGKGQIRTNFFADFTEWHLREFKLGKPCAATASCKLHVAHVTVKNNPADELFEGTHANTAAFEAKFLDQIPTLSRKNAATIAMATANNHNEFESSSQSGDVAYRNFTRATFRTKIGAAITNPNLSVDNILDRATTQTCGGCHQFGNARPNLGDGVSWKPSLGFVHVDESSNLSQALNEVFLPRRQAVLKSFLDKQCAREAVVDDGLTIGGSELDAAN